MNFELQADSLLPGGVPSVLGDSRQRYITKGKGGRCWDQLGQEYIDFICGYGPIILGHAHAEVNQAAIAQMEAGVLFPSDSPLHMELEKVLSALFPHTNRCLFLKTGSEAVSAAVRLARAFTGKMRIIRCGFLGWHDSMMAQHVGWHLYTADTHPPRSIVGIPDNLEILTWKGEDLEELKDLFRLNRGEIAALILDPIQLREPCDENLQALRNLTHTEEALLILDEIKTGFRVHLGGVQGLYGIQADLTLLSKALANGFPLSVVIGRAELVDLAGVTKIMGTYNNELLSVAAALKTIAILQRPGIVDGLWDRGQQLIAGLNGSLAEHGWGDLVQAVAYRWPCMPALWFRNAYLLEKKLPKELAKQGVLILANHPSFVCVEHTAEDVEAAIQRFDQTVVSLKKDLP